MSVNCVYLPCVRPWLVNTINQIAFSSVKLHKFVQLVYGLTSDCTRSVVVFVEVKSHFKVKVSRG